MICEMCGEDVPLTHRVEIEGSVLRLCEECRRFGQLLDPLIAPGAASPAAHPRGPGPGIPIRPRRLEERDLFREIPEMELAPDWGKRIRDARTRLNWTPEELGKRLNEKKSVVLKLEAGSFRPPDATIRKVENLLKVRLRAEPEPT